MRVTHIVILRVHPMVFQHWPKIIYIKRLSSSRMKTGMIRSMDYYNSSRTSSPRSRLSNRLKKLSDLSLS